MPKTLTCKAPDKMKLIVLVFALLMVISPQIRYTAGTLLHTTADILQNN
jgi:hypothetical protein